MELRITGNQLLDRIPAGERALILGNADYRALPINTYFARQGHPCSEVVFLTDGLASSLVNMPDGDTAETCILGSAEMVGLEAWLDHQPASSDLFMQVPGHGYVLTMTRFREVARRSPRLIERLQEQAGTQIRALVQTAACATRHEAMPRLARWLRSVQLRLGEDRFPLTHEYLAQMLSVRRPTVTMIATRLREDDVIGYRRGWIEVLDKAALARSACDCGEVIDQLYA